MSEKDSDRNDNERANYGTDTDPAEAYWGLCPSCRRNDGYVNVGREHWFFCETHRVKWCVGENLFSSWRHQTKDEWEENRALLEGYVEIKPVMPEGTEQGQEDRSEPNLEETDRLSPEEFKALPEAERERFFEAMDRENSPTPADFYGYEAVEDDRPWTEDAESCDSQPEPTTERRPEENLFGAVIFAYTRKQALADGVLVDVTETAREAGFKIPVALTRAVWSEYVEVPEGVEAQDKAGRLWDVLWMCRFGIGRKQDTPELLFQLYVRNDNREGEPPLVTLKAVCGPDDDGKPCITIMMPDED